LKKWTTVHSPEIDALNAELKKGKTLSQLDIDVRAEAILASLYKERDKEEGVDLYLPGNLKLFEEWWKKTYPLKKQKQYSPSYLRLFPIQCGQCLEVTQAHRFKSLSL
jgi:hypothetical protein